MLPREIKTGLERKQVGDLVIDSRLLKPGDIFCAVPGQSSDGRRFIQDVINKGAFAILYESGDGFVAESTSVPTFGIQNLTENLPTLADEFYEYPAQKLSLIGVTGTNGKTSVAHLLSQAFSGKNKNVGTLGTVGNGIWPKLEDSSLTTLDPVSLRKCFKYFLAKNCQKVLMEVSSHALSQGRVAGLIFDTAILTNLTRDHLDFHADMAAYAQAKSKLFEVTMSQSVVVNWDDPFVGQILNHRTSTVLTYSYKGHPKADVALLSEHLVGGGFILKVQTPVGELTLQSPLLGKFNNENILAVVGVLCLHGFSLSDIAHAVKNFQGVRGRMELVHHNPMLIIDYAHTPDALEKALLAARAHTLGKLWLLFGLGGNRDRGKRPLMSKIAERYADHVVFTEDNSRFEPIEQIFADVLSGFENLQKVTVIPSRAEAIFHVISQAGPTDCVLFAGKGHELYLDKLGKKEYFDERAIIQKVLKNVR